jgi:hypothetical protein
VLAAHEIRLGRYSFAQFKADAAARQRSFA